MKLGGLLIAALGVVLLVVFVVTATNEMVNKSKLAGTNEAGGFSRAEFAAKELKSGKYANDIFLGFSFGMNQRQVSKKINQLIKEKTLSPKTDLSWEIPYLNKTVSISGYKHDFYLKDYIGKALVTPGFYGDSLSGIEVLVYDFGEMKNDYNITNDLREIYEAKYGKGKTEKTGYNPLPIYWIKGNRQISIDKTEYGYLISYKNLLVDARVAHVDSLMRGLIKEGNKRKSIETANRI